MPTFIRRLAEKKVIDLGYAGFRNVVKYLNEGLGVEIDASVPEFPAVLELMEVRNIIVHNAGRINPLFLKRTGRSDLKSGALFPLNWNYVTVAAKSLRELAELIDLKIVSHFRLPRNVGEGGPIGLH